MGAVGAGWGRGSTRPTSSEDDPLIVRRKLGIFTPKRAGGWVLSSPRGEGQLSHPSSHLERRLYGLASAA